MAGNAFTDATGVWFIDTAAAIETGPVTITRIFFYPGAASDTIALTDASGNELFSLTAGDTYYETMHVDFTGEDGGGRRVPSLTIGTLTASRTANIWLKKTRFATTRAGQ